ncbi:MAG: ThuA domain-containing protein [Spirochaetales bacterium]|nr:ThuA domain-containing protein [Spirochaetales bacterium]
MKKALIFWGGWDGHEPDKVAAIFQDILVDAGVEVDITDSQEILNDADQVAMYDLIVPVWTMGTIESEKVQAITSAVENGTGIAGCHGGMCDAFRDSVDWQFMTGGNWVAHPGNDGTNYRVRITDGDHPLVTGITDFDVVSEQYYLHVDPAVTVLATTRFPVASGPHAVNGEVDMPVIWTKMWGKGKVYYNSLGHHADIFDDYEPRELMKRGLLWAIRD